MKKIFIICEGVSEVQYIQQVKRIMEQEYAVRDFKIIPEKYGGGETFSGITKNIRKAIKEASCGELNPRNEVYIWLDKDIFCRQLAGKLKEFEEFISNIKIPKKVTILYNHMSFEDFLVLHYENQKIIDLQTKLEKKRHFSIPLIADNYIPIYNSIMNNYRKGKLPCDFDLDLEKIKLCVKNIEDENIKFKSDIKEILNLIIEKCLEE